MCETDKRYQTSFKEYILSLNYKAGGSEFALRLTDNRHCTEQYNRLSMKIPPVQKKDYS
jgi:hypothetical protein